jgi:hypothetical protein
MARVGDSSAVAAAAALIERPLAAHAPARRFGSDSYPCPPGIPDPLASADPTAVTFALRAALLMSAATALGCDT